MKRVLQNITLSCALFSYIIVGVLGHLEILSLLRWQTGITQIVKAKADPQPTAKVYWTQHKHIPSTIKVSVPSPAIITPAETQSVFFHGIALIQDASHILTDPIFSLHSSRAPPQI
jgi:hypothetical protein